jgi:hypothetical protein
MLENMKITPEMQKNLKSVKFCVSYRLQKKVFQVGNTLEFCTFQQLKTKQDRLELVPNLMKIKLHHIFLLFLLTTPAFVNTVLAQDATTNQDYQITDTEREKYDRDKVIFSPGEGDTRVTPKGSQAMSGRDSIVVAKPNTQIQKAKPEQPIKAAEKQQQQTKDDDSILSFNFLYYIIQKYKLQDIVD